MRGRDLEQAVDAGADDEQRVAGAQPRPVLGAEHARERLDERRRQRVEAVGELEQLRDKLGHDPHALGEPAGVESRCAELLA